MNYNSRSREQVACWLKNAREMRSDILIGKSRRQTLTKEEYRKRIEREVNRRFKDEE